MALGVALGVAFAFGKGHPHLKNVNISKNYKTHAMTYKSYVLIILTHTNKNPRGIFHYTSRNAFSNTLKKQSGHPGGLYQT